MSPKEGTRQRIHNFFEKPQSKAAKFVQIFIGLLIVFSLANLVVHFQYPALFERYFLFFHYSEYLILGVFTLEYVLRVATAPNRIRFALKPMTIVDFLAVFPAYLELVLPLFVNTSSLRAVRLLRLLRFSRVLRAFKLFRFGNLFKKVFRYEGTIFQTITPVIVLFVVLKGVIWVLETYGYWLYDPSLGELFAIIGFALGIILSQKIGATYDKFLQVEEAVIRLDSAMRSLELILNKVEPGLGTKTCKRWARVFLKLLEDPKADNSILSSENALLYEAIAKSEDGPGDMAIFYGEICRDAAFCLSKKVRLTPKAYDTLLHQATMLYFTLIIVFIPGFTGMVSVILATYTLYGMYNLTEDLDSIIGGEFNLMNINTAEFHSFIAEGDSRA